VPVHYKGCGHQGNKWMGPVGWVWGGRAFIYLHSCAYVCMNVFTHVCIFLASRMDLYSDLPSKKVSPLCKIQCCGQFELFITSVLGTTFAFDTCIVFCLEIFWTSRLTSNFYSNQHGRSSVFVHFPDVFEAASKLLRVCITNSPFASRSLGRQRKESVEWKER